MGDVLKGAASAIGGVFGGPLGAMAGDAIGGWAGGMLSPTKQEARAGYGGPAYTGAYTKDYWAPNQDEDQYINRQFQRLATEYGQLGNQVGQELSNQGVGTSGTIGNFAQAMRVSQPMAQAQSNVLNEQYRQRQEGEQRQYDRQSDYNRSAMGADVDVSRANQQYDREANQAASQQASSIGGYLSRNLGGEESVDPKTGQKVRKPGAIQTVAQGMRNYGS